MKTYTQAIIVLLVLIISSGAYAYDYTTVNKDNQESGQKTEKKKVWNKAKKPKVENAQPQPEAAKDIKQIPAYVLGYARNVYNSCAGVWKSAQCVSAIAALSKDITIDYASSLEQAKQEAFHEPLKQSCAASTAAIQTDVPAYAQKSAMTECLNAIADMTQASGVKPNINLYQLAVGGTQCLDQEGNCEAFENQLAPLLGQQ